MSRVFTLKRRKIASDLSVSQFTDLVLLNWLKSIHALALDDMLLGIHLAQLRERMQITQEDMANTLGVKQPTIAGMERKGRDVKLSTLKRYVEGAGGKLTVDVELPDGSHYGFNL